MFVYDVTAYPLNNNEWSFPMAECFHILGFAFSIGTVAIVDLRLLGIGMLHLKPSQVLKDTRMWTMWGLAVMLITGPLIMFSDPVMYMHNASFQFKVFVAFPLAIIFNYTIHARAASWDEAPPEPGTGSAVLGLLGAAVGVAFDLACFLLIRMFFYNDSQVGLLAATGIIALVGIVLAAKALSRPARSTFIGGASVAMWLAVVAGGIFIAFV